MMDTRQGDKTQTIAHLIELRRVAKVVKGGKNFSFSALMVVGDGKGRVGYATGKSRDVTEAIRKGTDQAMKNWKRFTLREDRTVSHDERGRFGASEVLIRTAPLGTGVIAGGDMRAVFSALGVKDVVGKSLRRGCSQNVIAATFRALETMVSPRALAHMRGCKVADLFPKKSLTVKKGHAVS